MAIADIIWKQLEPRMKKVAEEAYKQGAEDVIRRFAFVYDTVATKAKEDAYAEVGAIDLDNLDEELSMKIFEEIGDV